MTSLQALKSKNNGNTVQKLDQNGILLTPKRAKHEIYTHFLSHILSFSLLYTHNQKLQKIREIIMLQR